MNNDTYPKSAISTAKVIMDLATFIAMFLADILSFEQLKYWQAHKSEMKKNLREAFKMPLDEFVEMCLDWQAFYKKRHSWDIDFSQVFIPPRPSPAHRLIIVAKGMTADKVYDAWPFLKLKNPSYGESFAVSVPKNARTSTDGHYAIWVLDCVEPDTEFLGKSTQVADPEMKVQMTLTERLLLEDKYFDETGKHLDIRGGTLCGGSRSAGDRVPYVDRDSDGWVGVRWFDLFDSLPGFGGRRAVSGPIST
jgi:hypothetical protein